VTLLQLFLASFSVNYCIDRVCCFVLLNRDWGFVTVPRFLHERADVTLSQQKNRALRGIFLTVHKKLEKIEIVILPARRRKHFQYLSDFCSPFILSQKIFFTHMYEQHDPKNPKKYTDLDYQFGGVDVVKASTISWASISN